MLKMCAVYIYYTIWGFLGYLHYLAIFILYEKNRMMTLTGDEKVRYILR